MMCSKIQFTLHLTILAAVLGLGSGAPARAEALYADSVSAAPAPPPAPPDSSGLPPADTARTVDDLWVLRTSLVRAEDVPQLVERAKAMGVRGLLVQVVGRGDAWYRSDLLPVPEAIRNQGRDPLGELVPLAHAAGLEVHAWMNCCLVWSGARLPVDRRHVVNAHPEWIARMADGRSMTRLGARDRKRLGVEGIFLSPAHPGVRTFLANVAREIATRYDVDGIHLDYIRHPSIAIGYDQTTRARFALEYGVDPSTFSRLSATARLRADSAWSAFQLAQVTAIVQEVRDSLDAARPGVVLSAAVIADTLAAVTRNRQAWSRWLREGLLDRAYAMCYAPLVQTVVSQMAAMSEQVGVARLVPGIAVYNTEPPAVAAKIKAARMLGFPAIALYSYDSLFEKPDLWARLKDLLAPRSLMEVRP